MRISKIITAIVYCAALGAMQAQAQSVDLAALTKSVDDLKLMVKSLQQTLAQQQTEIKLLKEQNRTLKTSSSTSASAPLESPMQTIASAPSAAAKSAAGYLPEIGAVADIVGLASKSSEDAEGNDRLGLRDFELVLGHDVDPYSRLDATIVFSDEEDPELEEAYASFWDLPLDSKMRIGKFKQKIGRAAAMHRDSLDTVDVPLVVQRYLGAEGFSKSGVDFSGYLPAFSDNFVQELVFGAMEGGNGEEGQLFGEFRRIPSLYARLRNSLDISDASTIDLGATWLNGSVDNESSREANAVGLDLTMTHFFSQNNKFKLQSEAFIVDRDVPELSDESELFYLDKDRPWGYYLLADYRLSDRWGLGTRWDWVQPIASESELVRDDEKALAGYITYYQSEFARWRLQYQHARLIDDSDDDRVYLQATFAIGTHKHALQ